MSEIQDYRVGPQTGKAGCLVIFFHGYDSGGRDMAQYLGSQLAGLAPEAVLRFPDGPRPVPWNQQGRSWFEVEDMLDMPDGNIAGPRAMAEVTYINRYIDRVMAEEGMPASRVIIAGFSQGATMAFFAALMRDQPVAGVFSISGGALDQLAVPRSKPPVMLLAGEREHSYYSGRELAEKTYHLLRQREFQAGLLFTPENGHNIDRRSVEELAGFIRHVLPRPVPAPAAPAPSCGL